MQLASWQQRRALLGPSVRRSAGGRPGGVIPRAASSSRSPAQPLADVAVKIPGAGRLAAQAAESISNPKTDKQQKRREQEQQRQQREEEREAARQQAALEELEQQQQQEEQLAVAASAAAADNILAAAEELTLAAAAAEGTDSVPEASRSAQTAAAVAAELSEYTEEEAPAKSLTERAADARAFLTSTATGKGISIAAGLFLGATFIIALYRSYQKYSSPRAQRKRVIDKNKLLNEELSKYLPDRRSELTPGVLQKLRRQTGFSPVEVFRKYLWFLLRERQFDAAAVADMVGLKAALGLTDDEVAEALRERAQRIYDKYGTLMLTVDGMTPEGVERKATCRALFRKLLYLTEHEPLVAADSEAFKTTDLRLVFGATDEDVDNIRIVSLHDIDLERLAALPDADPQQQGPQQQGNQPGGEKSSSS